MPDPFPVPDAFPYLLPPQDFGHGENGTIMGSTFRLTPFISLPEVGHATDNPLLQTDAYTDWRHKVATTGRIYEDCSRPSHLLGAPSVVQHDPLEQIASIARGEGRSQLIQRTDASLQDPANWQVLLHLASDEQLGFDYGGGVGAYTVVAPLADLRLGRYDRAYALWQF